MSSEQFVIKHSSKGRMEEILLFYW